MGVKAYIMAESKGKAQPTNEDYKDDGIGSASEFSEKYGEEKHDKTESK